MRGLARGCACLDRLLHRRGFLPGGRRTSTLRGSGPPTRPRISSSVGGCAPHAPAAARLGRGSCADPAPSPGGEPVLCGGNPPTPPAGEGARPQLRLPRWSVAPSGVLARRASERARCSARLDSGFLSPSVIPAKAGIQLARRPGCRLDGSLRPRGRAAPASPSPSPLSLEGERGPDPAWGVGCGPRKLRGGRGGAAPPTTERHRCGSTNTSRCAKRQRPPTRRSVSW